MKRCRGSLGQLLLLAALGTAALFAHLADGYAWCQEYWNWDGKRHSSTDGRRWPANDGVVITYINGIFHSVPDWESITHQLQTIFGHEVRPFYNPSSGWWITDASKAGYHLLRKPANDTIAHALGEHLAQAVEDVGRGRVLHIAHSGGALITYLAAQHHLTKRQRDKIDVVTFGGARSITRKYFSGRVVNYYARNDPLVKLDRRAAELMKLTNNTKFQEINEKHNTTFIFLEGRAKQFVLDHSLEGPTYQHALRKEARAFRRAHFGPLSPLSWDYDQSVFRLARKKMAQLSGLHHFFNTDPFGLRLARKGVARLTGLHGFFSGKRNSGRAIVPVIEGDLKAGEGDGVSEGSRRWWWPFTRGVETNSGQEADVISPPPVTEETPGADGGSGDRFWIGFRWPRRGSDKKDEAEVGGGSDGDHDLDLEVEAPVSLVVVAPPNRSLSARVRRGFWGLGRGSAATDADAEVENVDIIDVPDSEDSEEGTEVDDDDGDAKKREADARKYSSSSSSRPWLFSGWTPWGTRVEPTPDDEKASSVESNPDGDGKAEGQGEPPSSEREKKADGDGGATHIVGSAGVGDEATGPPSVSREDMSSIRRWWFGSNARVTAGESEGESGRGSRADESEELDDAGEGEEGGTDRVSLGDVGGNDVGEAGETTMMETGGLAAEASGLANGVSEGTKEREDEKSGASSMSLLSRWWPVGTAESGEGGVVEPAPPEDSAETPQQQQQQQQQQPSTEEATSVTPPALPPSVSNSAVEQQQGQPEPEDGAVAPLSGEEPDDKSQASPSPSLLWRWWPTSEPQRLEDTASTSPPTGHPVITGTAAPAEGAGETSPPSTEARASAPVSDVPEVDGVKSFRDDRGPGEAISEEGERAHELPRAAEEETLPESASEHQGQREEEGVADAARSFAARSDASGAEPAQTTTAAARGDEVDDLEAPATQGTTPRAPLVSRFWDVFTNRATDPEPDPAPVPPPTPTRHDDVASSALLSADAELSPQPSPEARLSASSDEDSSDASSPVASPSDVASSGDLAAQGNPPEGVPEDTEGAGEAGIREGFGSVSESLGGEVFVSEGFLQIGQADGDVEGESAPLNLPPAVDSEEGIPLGGGGERGIAKRVHEGRGEDRTNDNRDVDVEEEGWRDEVRVVDEETVGDKAVTKDQRWPEQRDEGCDEEEEEEEEICEDGDGQVEGDDFGAEGGGEGLVKQEQTTPRGGKGAVKEERVMNNGDDARR